MWSIYHLEVGTVFHSTDHDTKADIVLDLPNIGQLVRVRLEFGLLSPYPAGETSPETRTRKGVIRTCPTHYPATSCFGVGHLHSGLQM